ncbi:hypothetical protein FHS59_001666 [Algoriphagus iocasae]|uniref:TonB-dependent receptor plug domain-containing protein n=1 Tax=Algoriphagus iocasae TaxID=1836499 RepID=A0A841MTV4_9BACT|nr:carboxypeptidase-like regulatory domain-containing protein [Algoriphagus iocasae]MBB6326038.1 hypothetical protein [Algoriphagus iocasae]
MNHVIKLIIILIMLGSIPAFGQSDSLSFTFGKNLGNLAGSYVLTGKITDKDSGDPIEGVGLHVDGSFTGISSDRFGTYLINLKPGLHRVSFRNLAKIPLFTEISIYENAVLNLQMEDKSYELEGVVVISDQPDRNVREPITGITKLTTRELKAIPAFLGEADIFKGLQLLPGVSTVGEGTSGINVRGAKTDQNLLLMDEVMVLSSNHALGFLSAFNTDVTENFTLYKGNLPANFGGRSGSALNIQMRDGDRESWGGQVGIGTSNGKFLIEGPLAKDKISIIGGARISNTNWLLNQARNYDLKNSKLNFYDGYLGLSWNLAQGHVLKVNTLLTSDYFKFSDEFGYDWTNRVSSAIYKGVLGENFSVSALIADGDFNNSFFDPEGIEAASVSNGMRYQQGKFSGVWAKDNISVSGGVEAINYKGKPETLSPYGDFSSIQESKVGKEKGLEASLFTKIEWDLGEKTGIVAGIRYSTFSQMGPDTVYNYVEGAPITEENISGTEVKGDGKIVGYSGFEPRFSLRRNINLRTSLKLSYARLFQYVQSVSNTFGPTPIDLWQLSTTNIAPQKSDNFSVGIFHNSEGNTWEFSVDAFYRLTDNQIEYRNFAQIFQNPHLETELVFGEGKAYGMEFLIKKNMGLVTGWLAYTYSRSFFKTTSLYPEEQINDGEWFPSNYDKPHEVNFILSRKMYPRGLFNFSVNYSTGRPISAVNASYILNGLFVPDYSGRNEYRVPDYFRVDVSYTVEKVFSKKGDSLNFSIYNLLGRRNAYSVFWQKDGDSQQLRPYRLAVLGAIFPSISYSIKFGGGADE